MRDEVEGSARQLRAAWMGTLPDTVYKAVSDADLAAPYVYINPTASAHELPIARAELRRWSQAVELDAQHAEDVVLAVDEAVANAVEHAYAGGPPGIVTVFAGRSKPESKVYVVVSDAGHWRPPPADAGLRGRGVSMMKMLTDHFELHHNENGTTVLLGWNMR